MTQGCSSLNQSLSLLVRAPTHLLLEVSEAGNLSSYDLAESIRQCAVHQSYHRNMIRGVAGSLVFEWSI